MREPVQQQTGRLAGPRQGERHRNRQRQNQQRLGGHHKAGCQNFEFGRRHHIMSSGKTSTNAPASSAPAFDGSRIRALAAAKTDSKDESCFS